VNNQFKCACGPSPVMLGTGAEYLLLDSTTTASSPRAPQRPVQADLSLINCHAQTEAEFPCGQCPRFSPLELENITDSKPVEGRGPWR
jgi:hypothetical protein